jgi:hypothetical protein
MRKVYSLGVAAFLIASPAMAQVVIGGGNDAARHEQRAQQDRFDARRDASEAQRHAAAGDYRGAAREQREARDEMHDARRQEHKADRDEHGGVNLPFGR